MLGILQHKSNIYQKWRFKRFKTASILTVSLLRSEFTSSVAPLDDVVNVVLEASERCPLFLFLPPTFCRLATAGDTERIAEVFEGAVFVMTDDTTETLAGEDE